MNNENLTDQISIGFSALKCQFREHPMQQERRVHRQLYYELFKYLVSFEQHAIDSTFKRDIFSFSCRSLQASLSLRPDSKPKLLAASADTDYIKKQTARLSSIFWHGCFRFGLKNYTYLLLLETSYFICLLNGYTDGRIRNAKLKNIWNLFALSEEDEKKIREFLGFLINPDKKGNTGDITEPFFSYMQQSYARIQRYTHEQKYHVAVCATMSSGKSTFINALLGNDYIPSANEACTAKITSIADNDKLQTVLGCYQKEKALQNFTTHVNADILQQWNQDNAIEHVYLEGDLQQINSDTGVLVIHDTPGTNFSRNETHQKKTMTFLKNHDLQMIVYVLNAEQVSTTDNHLLLQAIKHQVIDKGQTQMLFLLNKVDSFDDEQGDDLRECLSGVEKELTDMGFKDPVIIPIMSKAARLFKMALQGKSSQFSRRELSDFQMFYSLCMEYDMDVQPFIDEKWKIADAPKIDGTVQVGGTDYAKQDVIEAIAHTGFPIVASFINKALNSFCK